MNSDMFPLLSIAYLWVEQLSDGKPEETINLAKTAVRQYIYHAISYEDASKVCQDSIGSIAPVSKLQAILNIIKNNEYPKRDNDEHLMNRNTRNWSLPEDFRLLAAIHIFGLGKWKRISEFVGYGRTRSQCSQRWTRALNPRLMKTVLTIEEEEKLLNLVTKYGCHSWSTISKEMVGRSDVQCRYKYMQIKKKKRNFNCNDVNHTIEENQKPLAIDDHLKMLSIPPIKNYANQGTSYSSGLLIKPVLPSLNNVINETTLYPNTSYGFPNLQTLRFPTFISPQIGTVTIPHDPIYIIKSD